jgi:hypothetical protein
MPIRLDLIFTYWVFAWYLAYMANLTSYNPKLALILGIAINTLIAIAVLVNGGKISSIFSFLFVNILLKGIPLYTIYNTKITEKDVYALEGIFAIYLIWVHINIKSVTGITKNIYESILHEKNETPAILILSKLRNYYQ